MPLNFSSKPSVFIPTWNDNDKLPENERIVINYKPLKVKDVFKIQSLLNENERQSIEEENTTSEDFTNYWSVISQVLTEYTFDWGNVTIDDEVVTEPQKIIEVFTANEFDLLNEIFTHVMGQASVTEEESKNSETPSEEAV
tara:strand:+ start:832 stop:1254 length:423 start_codon:yes stop_codon:yes gene_type:complete